MKKTLAFCWSLLTTLPLLAAACSAPGGPGAFPAEPVGVPEPGPSPAPAQSLCVPAKASESLVARSSALNSASGSKAAPSTMFTQDLFELFNSNCGSCHVRGNQGNFSVNRATFASRMDDVAIATIKINDANNKKLMPPPAAGGKPFKDRKSDDPIVVFSRLLDTWKDQNRPADVFNIKSGGGAGALYKLSPEVGSTLTNLGNCIPPATMFGKQQPAMDDMDTKFAAATELPSSLDKTDLIGFDSADLAQRGLVAYVPTYPLFSDAAAKLRYIRVPRGQSVKFDKARQEFQIPPNTRFYKTFLKKVVDLSGKVAFRKLETRIIVSRPDSTNPDGTLQINSLFGTYVWNKEETGADLLRDPQNNAQPFADRIITYEQDEQLYKKILDSKPANLRFALFDENPKLMRQYAIPGRQRCIDCHMGGPEQGAFVLGFSPLQIHRRAQDTGGTYEPTGADELTQLQRMIDYGVITGISSVSEVTLLEDSQGTRKPRNDEELKAQAYMLGNCAHCHNPRGLPSKNPELSEALNFLPGQSVGGIFQFPLERYSPVRRRGGDQDVRMPYITPSLYDYPVDPKKAGLNWTRKGALCSSASVLDEKNNDLCNKRWSGAELFTAHLHAPWRSLIYRNVDTPFAYADDYAMFPRMPMHSSSYDCRAPRIMAEWMVSIPAKRKRPEIDETYDVGSLVRVNADTTIEPPPDNSEQPYEEVPEGDPGIAKAKLTAMSRLEMLHASPKYNYCPPDDDIVDRVIQRGAGAVGTRLVPEDFEIIDKNDPLKVILPQDGVPNRTHFVTSDLTEAPGDWGPRNGTWEKVLVKGEGSEFQKPVAQTLKTVSMTDQLRAFALTEVPMALWSEKAGCAAKLSAVPTVAEIKAKGPSAPDWMIHNNLAPTAKVYMQAPGEAVFRTICRNCHGPNADSGGILAQAILEMTGGKGRVANFRKGIFGPEGKVGENRIRVFGPPPASVDAAENWAARYFSWMALGGTEVSLPPALLNIVATTGVFGQQRPSNKLPAEGSPNMLKLGQDLCAQVLRAHAGDTAAFIGSLLETGRIDWGKQTALISRNGDAEMWLKLCSMGNETVVRVLTPSAGWTAVNAASKEGVRLDPLDSLYFGKGYPLEKDVKFDEGEGVADQNGKVHRTITADNLFPLCLKKPTEPTAFGFAEEYRKNFRLGGATGPKIPYCPEALVKTNEWKFKSVINSESNTFIFTDQLAWARRGAANAGFSIFLYLDQFLKKAEKPKPDFNHCEELP